MLDKRKFYINGKWVLPIKPNDLEVINPSTEEPCAVISIGSKEDTNAAVSAAKTAFQTWRESSKEQRIILLEKLLEIYIKAISINGQDAEREMRFFSIQRNLKILGIFCRLSMRDKKDGYLKYLPNAVKLLRKNLQDPFFINLVNWLKQFKNHELI